MSFGVFFLWVSEAEADSAAVSASLAGRRSGRSNEAALRVNMLHFGSNMKKPLEFESNLTSAGRPSAAARTLLHEYDTEMPPTSFYYSVIFWKFNSLPHWS